MTSKLQYHRLDSAENSLVFRQDGTRGVDLIYYGLRLPEGENMADLGASRLFGHHENAPDITPVAGLLPEDKDGLQGSTALSLSSAQKKMHTNFALMQVNTVHDALVCTWEDTHHALRLELKWQMKGGVITSCYTLYNDGHKAIAIDSMASLILPLPPRFTKLTHFPGRWAREMESHTQKIDRGVFEQNSRGGKPGFNGGNWLVFSDEYTEQEIGVHLCWSGDYLTRVEQNQSGQAQLSGSARLDPEEIILKAGESYQTPQAVFALGSDSDDLAQKFHQHLREEVLPDRAKWPPRRVHINSWEALAFDMDDGKLKTLADHAAGIGVERFVLDDGWFTGRRDDSSALGDWTVDKTLFPHGLTPLIDHIHEKSMDFGLWVEPEMISPDSDLYRAHPDWCLHLPGSERITERNQLVLDLTITEAAEYIFTAINALLTEYDIAYLKWDHNRQLFPRHNADGPAGYKQALAIYALIDELRNTHPTVEIESCSSGGGRIDYAMLSRVHRVWPSDNNDAIERLRINQSWSRFLPLEVIGNHVGPSPNPITGRSLAMDFRAKVALFGHMGVEANPADMTADERAVLAAHIALYKTWRDVLHSGKLFQLDHPEESIFGQMVTGEDSAIAMIAQTGFAANFNVAPVRFKGLDPAAQYTVTLPKPWPYKAALYLAKPELWEKGLILSGQALIESGIALPLTHSETAWIITFVKTGL